jgi:hypothetical protein
MKGGLQHSPLIKDSQSIDVSLHYMSILIITNQMLVVLPFLLPLAVLQVFSNQLLLSFTNEMLLRGPQAVIICIPPIW